MKNTINMLVSKDKLTMDVAADFTIDVTTEPAHLADMIQFLLDKCRNEDKDEKAVVPPGKYNVRLLAVVYDVGDENA